MAAKAKVGGRLAGLVGENGVVPTGIGEHRSGEKAPGFVGVVPAAKVVVTIPQLRIERMRLRIVGDSPLVTHAWDHKAKGIMLGKQMHEPKMAKGAKDPFADFVGSLYWMSERPAKPTQKDVDKGTFGVPAIALKKAAVQAATFVEDFAKTELRGAFHVIGDMVKIIAPPPRMREDMVRLSSGSADIRFRGEFSPWELEFDVRFNLSFISAAQLVNLYNVAGFAVGLGENRPERKGGGWGMFHVAID